MKEILVKLFWPILRVFESGQEPINYKKSHRIILLVVGSLFLLLSMGSAVSAFHSGGVGAIIPIIIFFAVGLVAVVIGALGSDSAVVKIWGKS